MKKLLHLALRLPAFGLMFSLAFGTLAPVSALAASKHSTHEEAAATASFDTASLMADTSKHARLSGTATSTKKVRFMVTASTSSKTLFKSKTLKVRDNEWNGKITKRIPDGTYTVTLYNADSRKKEKLAEGTLVIGIPDAKLWVQPIALLGGGMTTAGKTVPISYLQVVNQGTETAEIKGFWVAQNGTAPDAAVTAFMSVDGSGGSRATSTEAMPLKKGSAYVPSTATIAPGERKLFTLKAQLSPTARAYAGNTLMLNVTGIDALATFSTSFPIRGTTWVIGG